MWVNSLGIKGCYVNNLITDVKDGVLLCQVMDFICPNKVEFKKLSLKKKNTKFAKIQNANYSI